MGHEYTWIAEAGYRRVVRVSNSVLAYLSTGYGPQIRKNPWLGLGGAE